MGIREAADFLGATPSTLRRWEREGKILPDERTVGAIGDTI
ncbi:MAG: MerR family DNA-binding transcriptional regulator [Sulfobacillus sp.]